jgi:hypothetical protein
MDAIQKDRGIPFALSRKLTRINKKRTNAARRQAGRREIRNYRNDNDQ